jgi:hypothetical protein
MRKIVSIKFGSHLYGTSTPQSDVDLKSVYVPAAQDILMQRVKGSINNQRPKNQGEKNYAGEIDEESYSLQRFLSLASEGQTVALDVLFAPEWSMTAPPSLEWREIITNRSKILTKKSAAFVGYCRQQANKYGIKGSRVAASRLALKVLDDEVRALGTTAKLGEIGDAIHGYCRANPEHMAVVPMEQFGGTVINHWEVCGRKLSFTATIKHARDVVAKLVDEYCKRSLMAESQQGIDWKALSHAVRVGTQALELLRTGHITFPLPNAQHVMDVKLGRVPYQTVAGEIESLLERVEAMSEVSALPAEPDRAWIEAFVARVHEREVVEAAVEDKARAFAVAAHAATGQKRKYTDAPYITHPAAVVEIVRTVPHTRAMLAAAWLHDVVEDTQVTLETVTAEFGDEIGQLVYWLTDKSRPEDGNRARRKAIDRLHSSSAPPEAQTIKLADIIENTSTIDQYDPEFAKVYRKEKEDLLDLMNKGDTQLLSRAWKQLAQFDEKRLQDHLSRFSVSG